MCITKATPGRMLISFPPYVDNEHTTAIQLAYSQDGINNYGS